MNVPQLFIAGVTAKAVVAPLVRPVKTAVGTIPAAPLVLIDVTTREGITGKAYIFAYTTTALPALHRDSHSRSQLRSQQLIRTR